MLTATDQSEAYRSTYRARLLVSAFILDQVAGGMGEECVACCVCLLVPLFIIIAIGNFGLSIAEIVIGKSTKIDF